VRYQLPQLRAASQTQGAVMLELKLELRVDLRVLLAIIVVFTN
jgi:hypothetical protein